MENLGDFLGTSRKIRFIAVSLSGQHGDFTKRNYDSKNSKNFQTLRTKDSKNEAGEIEAFIVFDLSFLFGKNPIKFCHNRNYYVALVVQNWRFGFFSNDVQRNSHARQKIRTWDW